jgi:hypothetical protein
MRRSFIHNDIAGSGDKVHKRFGDTFLSGFFVSGPALFHLTINKQQENERSKLQARSD